MTDALLRPDYANAICCANSGDYDPAGSGFARTHQLDFTSLNNGSAIQSDKIDLGANLPSSWALYSAVDLASTPGSSGRSFFYYWGGTPDDGKGFPGGLTGVAGSYTGTSGDTLSNTLTAALESIGYLSVTTDSGVHYQPRQIIPAGRLGRFGSLVAYNDSGVNHDSNGVNSFVALVPLIRTNN